VKLKTNLPIILLAALCLAACDKQETTKPAAESANNPMTILKVSVLQSGKILADGAEISLANLDSRLTQLETQKGVVWYYREAAQGEPPPIAMEVMQLVVKHRLPISMSSKPDFSDAIDANGQSRPRQK